LRDHHCSFAKKLLQVFFLIFKTKNKKKQKTKKKTKNNPIAIEISIRWRGEAKQKREKPPTAEPTHQITTKKIKPTATEIDIR